MNQIVLAIACGVLAPIVGFRVGGLVLLAVLGMTVETVRRRLGEAA